MCGFRCDSVLKLKMDVTRFMNDPGGVMQPDVCLRQSVWPMSCLIAYSKPGISRGQVLINSRWVQTSPAQLERQITSIPCHYPADGCCTRCRIWRDGNIFVNNGRRRPQILWKVWHFLPSERANRKTPRWDTWWRTTRRTIRSCQTDNLEWPSEYKLPSKRAVTDKHIASLRSCQAFPRYCPVLCVYLRPKSRCLFRLNEKRQPRRSNMPLCLG